MRIQGFLCFCSAALLAVSACADAPAPLNILPGERLLVLAPHPDDEVLGAAGLMQQVLARGGSVRVAIATAGDGYVEAVEQETGQLRPKPANYLQYGETRLAEAARAANVLGNGHGRLDLLGFPDGGIHPLLIAHWSRLHPERSETTGMNAVPYAETEDKGLPYDGADLRNQLVRILKQERPTLIAFPDAMDWHPDHDGLALFALLAIGDWLEKQHGPAAPGAQANQPRLLAYLVHWYHDWPSGSSAGKPADLSEQPLFLPDDLPVRGHDRACVFLDRSQRAVKSHALAQYQTQQRAMGAFLAAFVRSSECYSVLKIPDAEKIEALMEQKRHARSKPPGIKPVPPVMSQNQ